MHRRVRRTNNSRRPEAEAEGVETTRPQKSKAQSAASRQEGSAKEEGQEAEKGCESA